MGTQNPLAWAQTIILGVTGLVVGIYTVLTYRLWRQMFRQNELSLMPAIVPYFTERANSDASPWEPVLELQNIGHGAALNVQVESITIEFTDELGQLIGPKTVEFEPLPYLGTGQAMPVQFGTRSTGDFSKFWAGILFPRTVQKEFTLPIRFENIEGVKYLVRITLKPDPKGQRPATVCLEPVRRDS